MACLVCSLRIPQRTAGRHADSRRLRAGRRCPEHRNRLPEFDRLAQTEATIMNIIRYVRYATAGKTSYGILEGETIRELHGDIFTGAEPTGKTLSIRDVKLLAPCRPSNVAAVGRNYKSHIADRNIQPAPFPGLFWKPSSCIVGTEENIVLPEGANNVHYEAELVVVIGKQARNVTPAEAPKYIFGITAGN